MIVGDNFKVGDGFQKLNDGFVLIGDDVKIGRDVTFNVSERLEIGPRSVIGDYAIIEGRDIKIGAEFWSDRYIQIGGGSCLEEMSSLEIGYWCHLGRDTFINTARPVKLGNEVGLGTGTKLYTHGAYLSALEGYPVDFKPVTLGSRVWVPGATILPGVTIGSDVVIGVGSVVTRDIPSGALALGVPARVVKEEAYPSPLSLEDRLKWIDLFMIRLGFNYVSSWDYIHLYETETTFHLEKKIVMGPVSEASERVRNELRRYGVRFKSYPRDGRYVSWGAD